MEHNLPYIGYHTPILKKSFQKSIETSHKNSGINAFQVFLRNPRQLRCIEHNETEALKCNEYIKQNNFFLVSHATYLLNSATEDDFEKKVESAINELTYAEKVGAIGSVFHVGKRLKQDEETGTNHMYHFISTVIQKLQEIECKSIFILETSASAGTELLSSMEKLGEFYHRFPEHLKNQLKICIDTCHIFAAGYSLKTIIATDSYINLVETHIQWNNVILIHLNDCKKDCGCKVDRHENLRKGYISKDNDEGMAHFVKYCVQRNIPLILETPHNDDDIYEVYREDLDIIQQWIE